MRAEDRWLALVPRDTVFVRDGRAFDAGSDAVAHTVMPGPSTTAGATGAAFGGEIEEVRGPVLARRERAAWVPYFPAPLDVVSEAGPSSYAYRLRPEPVTGTTDLGMELEWLSPPPDAGRTDPLARLLDRAGLGDYLAGVWPGPQGSPVDDVDHRASPLRPESRVGLARDGRAVRSGFLYRAVHQRPEEGWALLSGCVHAPDAPAPSGPVQLGGRGRLVDVEDAAGPVWPARPDAFPGGRLALYLATPAIWAEGWLPPMPAGARLVAAATGEPQPVATTTPGPHWRQERALRWAVPAGSVYLMRFDDEAGAARFAGHVHGHAYEQAHERLRTAGFGVVLTGVWE